MSQKLEEARLIAIYRAIRKFDEPGLIDISDLGDAYQALVLLGDLAEKEELWEQKDLDIFVDGFITGLAASRVADAVNLLPGEAEGVEHVMYEPRPDDTIAGGPTGGVVQGQISGDPNYVSQTGKV